MAKNVFQPRLIVGVVLALGLTIALISACGLIGGNDAANQPKETKIVSPAENASVLRTAPVQIQSIFADKAVARVELWGRGPDEQTDRLIRSDIPTDGTVLQPYTANQIGPNYLKVKAFNAENVVVAELPRTLQVVEQVAVTLATPVPVIPTPTVRPGAPTTIAATPLAVGTPAPNDSGGAFSQTADGTPYMVIEMVATLPPPPTATTTPFYPPPPPAPGVPPGPTQSPALNVHPPVCDAAEYMGPYAPGTDTQIYLPTIDDVPVKVAAGSLVHRAWQMRNTGTCTWGAGYELAFYGGRAMGSGGVAFEALFPPGEVRPNTTTSDRLVVPSGKPNQTAVLETLLKVPTIPGIHQSYWRMRNPQGVFFGPIVGVTIEVVRDCQVAGQTIYGVPTINYFRLVNLGGVYQPTPIAVAPVTPLPATPVPPAFQGTTGGRFQVEWSVSNADGYDVIYQNATGKTTQLGTDSPSDRSDPITLTETGSYYLTIYADNNACTVSQQLRIDVYPAVDDQLYVSMTFSQAAQQYMYPLDRRVAFSSTVPAGYVAVNLTYSGPPGQEFMFQGQPVTVPSTQQVCLPFDLCFNMSNTEAVPDGMLQVANLGTTGGLIRDTFTPYCQAKVQQGSTVPAGITFDVVSIPEQTIKLQPPLSVKCIQTVPVITPLPTEIRQP